MTDADRLIARLREYGESPHNLALEDTKDKHFKRPTGGPAVRLADVERLVREHLAAAEGTPGRAYLQPPPGEEQVAEIRVNMARSDATMFDRCQTGEVLDDLLIVLDRCKE